MANGQWQACGNNLAKLRLKPTKNDSVFLDFRVYKGSVNTEIKEHGDQSTPSNDFIGFTYHR